VFFFAFVTLLAISVAPAAPADGGLSSSAHPSPPSARGGHAIASDAYALRARRRFAAYLRLRLLEMREAGLQRAADVVERRLPIDTLIPQRRSP